MEKASKGMICYACGSKAAKPRDIGGTLYFLCDECFNQHIWANFKAVEYLKNQKNKNMKSHRKDLRRVGKNNYLAIQLYARD